MNARLILIPVLMLSMAACSAPPAGTANAPKTAPSAAPGATPGAAPATGATASNDEAKTIAKEMLAELNKGTEKMKKADSLDSMVASVKDTTAGIRPQSKKMREKFPAMYAAGAEDKGKEILGEELNKSLGDSLAAFMEAAGEAGKRNNVPDSSPEMKAAGEDLFKALDGQ